MLAGLDFGARFNWSRAASKRYKKSASRSQRTGVIDSAASPVASDGDASVRQHPAALLPRHRPLLLLLSLPELLTDTVPFVRPLRPVKTRNLISRLTNHLSHV